MRVDQRPPATARCRAQRNNQIFLLHKARRAERGQAQKRETHLRGEEGKKRASVGEKSADEALTRPAQGGLRARGGQRGVEQRAHAGVRGARDKAGRKVREMAREKGAERRGHVARQQVPARVLVGEPAAAPRRRHAAAHEHRTHRGPVLVVLRPFPLGGGSGGIVGGGRDGDRGRCLVGKGGEKAVGGEPEGQGQLHEAARGLERDGRAEATAAAGQKLAQNGAADVDGAAARAGQRGRQCPCGVQPLVPAARPPANCAPSQSNQCVRVHTCPG